MKTQAIKNLIHPKSRRQWGQSIALMVVALPAFVGTVGLAIDVGNFYFNYYKVQTGADATVLSAVRYLPDTSAAQTAACCGAASYGTLNGLKGTDTVTFPTLTVSTIQMQVVRTVPYYFARLAGVNNGTLTCVLDRRHWPPGFDQSNQLLQRLLNPVLP